MAVDSGTVVLKTVTAPLKAGLDVAWGLIQDLGRKIATTTATAFKVFFEQMPLFLADFGTGLRAGMRELRTFDESLTQIVTRIRATGAAAGRSADDIERMANRIQSVSTYSKSAALSAAAMVLQFRNVRGDVFDRVNKLAADLATQLGTTLPQAAGRLASILNDPAQGFDELYQMGVRFSSWEREFIAQMIRSGRVYEAQHVILNRIAQLYGGAAAEHAKTFSGQIDRINNLMTETWRVMADSLVPIFEVFLPLIEDGTKFSARLAGAFKELAVVAAGWATDALPKIREFFDQVMIYATQAGQWIIDKFVGAYSFIEMIVGMIADAFSGVPGKVLETFSSAASIIVDTLSAAFDIIKTLVAEAAQWIADTLITGLALVKTVIESWPVVWEAIIRQIKVIWLELTVFLRETFDTVYAYLRDMFFKVYEAFYNPIMKIDNSWRKLLSGMLIEYAKFLRSLVSKGGFLNDTVNKALSDAANSAFSAATNMNYNRMRELEQPDALPPPRGMTDEERAEIDANKQWIQEAKDILGEEWGVNQDQVTESVNEIKEAVKGAMGQWDKIKEVNKDALDDVISNIRDRVNEGLSDADGRASGRGDMRGLPGMDQPFNFKRESSSAGAFEGLEALQRRIQSAAFQSPEARAIDRLITQARNDHRDAQRLRTAQLRAAEETREALNQRQPNDAPSRWS